MDTNTDSLVYILDSISKRLKEDVALHVPKKTKLIKKCAASCRRKQRLYNDWEKNMMVIMNGAEQMSSLRDLAGYNGEIRLAVLKFHEAINSGKEKMKETKRELISKCKRIYKELEIRNHGRERVIENIKGVSAVLSQGLIAMSSLVRKNYEETREACINVFTQYNIAVKSMTQKQRKKHSCQKIVITRKKLISHIGRMPGSGKAKQD